MTQLAKIPSRLIVEPHPLSGAENMQRDEALLAAAVAGEPQTTVRIYRWSEPTVSLGYFQDPAAPIDPRLASCPRVRRLTGGGAILHDREITYSCVISAQHARSRKPLELYQVVHEAIISLMAASGVKASLRGETPATDKPEPGLCFLRQDPRDIVACGHKVVGSAQRRRKRTILQHGSILLQASDLIPEVIGLQDLARDFQVSMFADKIGHQLLDQLAS